MIPDEALADLNPQVATFQCSVSLEGMRLLRVLLIALFGVFAVVAGLITATAVSLATGLVLMLKRALVPGQRGGLPRREPQRFSRQASGDIIDVTATEVPADSAPR